ncbi:DUF3558 domain-containing protein [Rhodococcus spelaei]|uniref:DUF3558 domain-containing protein n=1 Tax=Rhodococcus spelaei TaxID=2546320 RepID=A0A541AZW2_9NOCA|nr:DUF3558 domain-containing protein [Rhodococcus spelaei]TQF65592.1 DUF3558 domain-containing protein [Rhodococcus spelaei]
MRRPVWAAVAAVGVVSGCATSVPGDAVSSGPDGVSVSTVPSKLVAPTQINDTGRPDVTFDPCLDLGDDTIRGLGVDPTTRKRDDSVFSTYAFLSCTFQSDLNIVRISSSNITLQEYRDRFGAVAEPINVNGREAIMLRDEVETCDIVMHTREGVVWTKSSLRSEARKRGMDKCDGLLELSQKVEPLIPEEN